jgi:tRNA A58 N-methylase Trm61
VVDALDGGVSNNLKNKGYWEPESLKAMARYVKEGSRILNAGSHIGLEAIVLGKIAGPTGKLFIFEPMPTTYGMVLRNVYLHKLHNMASVYNLGCSNKYSARTIITPLSNTGNSVINDDLLFEP